jgi:hypothetical protein
MPEKKRINTYLNMDCKNIMKRGEEAKYAMRIDAQGFSMESDDFEVELSWGMRDRKLLIPKSEMIFSIDGYYYFIFDTSEMIGKVTAKCTYYVPDFDCPDGLRTEVDTQFLCLIVTDPLPRTACVPAPSQCEHKVTYERTDQSDVASDYQYLASTEGDRFITIDTEYILVLKSAEDNNYNNANN